MVTAATHLYTFFARTLVKSNRSDYNCPSRLGHKQWFKNFLKKINNLLLNYSLSVLTSHKEYQQ